MRYNCPILNNECLKNGEVIPLYRRFVGRLFYLLSQINDHATPECTRTVGTECPALFVISGLLLFGSAGTFKFWQAWVYLFGTIVMPGIK
jgi:hypothetical protein